MTLRRAIFATLAPLVLTAALAGAQATPVPPAGSGSASTRQSLDDAWWTGPLLAPSAATLPRGHVLIEPYLFDVISAHANGFGSLTYINYGLFDKITVGLIPTADYSRVSNGPSSSGAGFGDLTVQAQYRLTKFRMGSWIPTTSVNVQETLPTGKFDRLGNTPSDGVGSGAYTTTLGLYSQTYFWMPNGRVLRMRFNLAQGFSSRANVHDVSVYGTGEGFRGHANPGSSFLIDLAAEYSVTKRWVLAMDVIHHQSGNTAATGNNALDPAAPSIRLDSGSSAGFGFAPAVEYNWNSRVGVIFGMRAIAPGRNTSVTITPAVAINIVH